MGSIAFIGGGNMASAIVGGLRRGGRAGESLIVVDPSPQQRARLEGEHGVRTLAAADATLAAADLVVWAVKPQFFGAAADAAAPHLRGALHLSVMAGIRSDALARAAGTERIVRAMPNTPALIGQGISGLFARPAVDERGRAAVAREADLDAVTALSGSGPAYVFYVAEAMVRAARDMGLDPAQGRELALATLAGAAALAQSSPEALEVLRERVTSKGGTTHAALSALEADGVGAAIVRAIRAAEARARELGDTFG